MKVFACSCACLLTALALAAPASALERGSPDGGRHPAVGALAWHAPGQDPPAWNFLCSGFVVSDRVFVTAAHCIEAIPRGPVGRNARVRLARPAHRDRDLPG